MLCLECGAPMSSRGYGTTLVGFNQQLCSAGNVHDDNCRNHRMRCANGHERRVNQRQTCACGWKGKLTCFCHEGEKIEFDPNEQLAEP